MYHVHVACGRACAHTRVHVCMRTACMARGRCAVAGADACIHMYIYVHIYTLYMHIHVYKEAFAQTSTHFCAYVACMGGQQPAARA